MLLSRLERSLISAQRGPFLRPDDGTNGGGGSGAGDQSASNASVNSNANSGGQQEDGTGDGDGKKSVEFTDEQRAELGRIVAKERRAAEAKARADAKAEADAAAETARKAKEAEDAKKAGDFEAVEKQLKADADAAKAEATTLQERVDKLTAAMKAGVDAQWKELPEFIRTIGEKFAPEDDVLARWNYLNDPDVQKQVKESSKETARGNGRDPKAGGTGTPELKSLINVGAHI